LRTYVENYRPLAVLCGHIHEARSASLVIILPVIDRRRIIDLRLVTFDVPKQRIITKDNVG
jgi:regulator of protease activity HflC (stomatin/prohibitin superfamily)